MTPIWSQKIGWHRWAPYTLPAAHAPVATQRTRAPNPWQTPGPATWVLGAHRPRPADNTAVNPPWRWNKPLPEEV
jgi:hypothetical protein